MRSFARKCRHVILLIFIALILVGLTWRLFHEQTKKRLRRSDRSVTFPKGMPGSKCFISMVAGTHSIFPALVLYHRLIRVHEPEPVCLLALVDHDVNSLAAGLFEALGVSIINMVSKDFIEPNYKTEKIKTLLRDKTLWNKLKVWSLIEYQQLVFLDIDIVVLLPLSELFSLNVVFAGVPALYPEEKVLFSTPVTPFEIDPRSPKAWGELKRLETMTIGFDGLNAGVMVMRPDTKIYEALCNATSYLEERLCCPLQEFLYRFFELQGLYHRLEAIYNMRKHGLDSNSDSSQIKIYHFVERKKPWMLGRRQSEGNAFAKTWWSHADNMVRDFDKRLSDEDPLKRGLRLSFYESTHMGLTHLF